MRHKAIIATLIFWALAAFGGYALAGDTMEFTFDGIENSTVLRTGPSYSSFYCQVTERTGINNTVVNIRASIAPTLTDDKTLVLAVNSSIVNSTDASTDNSSWHFQKNDWGYTALRADCIWGCDVGNTVTGVCRVGGR